MIIEINKKFYNFNNITHYYFTEDDLLCIYFIDKSSTVVYNVSNELKELLTKKLVYEFNRNCRKIFREEVST